jgi:hypothetical protein
LLSANLPIPFGGFIFGCPILNKQYGLNGTTENCAAGCSLILQALVATGGGHSPTKLYVNSDGL